MRVGADEQRLWTDRGHASFVQSPIQHTPCLIIEGVVAACRYVEVVVSVSRIVAAVQLWQGKDC